MLSDMKLAPASGRVYRGYILACMLIHLWAAYGPTWQSHHQSQWYTWVHMTRIRLTQRYYVCIWYYIMISIYQDLPQQEGMFHDSLRGQ